MFRCSPRSAIACLAAGLLASAPLCAEQDAPPVLRGDLLDFTPVPRKLNRADGWSAEKQRAFIAALSAALSEASR